MKNILITGGCGFIGSNYINYIFKKYNDFNIINIDAMYYCASEKNIEEEIRNSERYTLIKGNLCSYDLVYHIINNYKIEYVIHFAAQSHVQNSFDDALQYTTDNILGTHNLLEVVRRYGKIKKFIHVSTDEVYGESMIEKDENKKTEESILCPTNPYAATKASAELIAQSYYYSFNIPIIITRGNNVYGPNQYPEKLISKFISLLKNDKKCTIQGDGTSIRSFIHVKDVCNAVCTIMEKGIVGEIYNIGSEPENELTVIQVFELLLSIIKPNEKKEDWIEYIEDRPFNDKRYFITNDKLKALGWTQHIKFNKGIFELI